MPDEMPTEELARKYTRLPNRKMGLASRMIQELPGGPVIYTHRSRGLARVPEGWQFTLRPLLAILVSVPEQEAA
jgi:hypothetical protein